jgi:hypothetical protein
MNGELLARSPAAPAPASAPDARLRPTLSMPVPLPIHSRGTGVLESPGRFTETPVFSAVSPVSGPFQSDLDRSPRHHLHHHHHHHHHRRRNNSDDATSTQGSYDLDDMMELDDGNSLKRLHNDDAYSASGSKRRAPSPADEHMHGVAAGPSDLVRRRGGDMGSRGSPRLSTIPQGSSMTAASRSNSYMSTASTATTASFGRRSPVASFSPGGMSPTCSSPYATPISLNPSPRASISGRSVAHHTHSRQMSGAGVSVGASPRKPHDLQKPGSKLQGFFMCECCPKKPKKFDTADELR